MDRLSVAEAAKVLGVTQAAVYKRIQRDTIAHVKDDEGHVFVYVDPTNIPTDKSMDGGAESTDKPPVKSMDESNSQELIAELRTHNEHLRQEVEAWREEARRKDTIIMTMAQRIPELEPARDASPEPREAPQTAAEEEDRGTGHPDVTGPQKRSTWWRWLFGTE
jgi:hypothetical protein